MREWKSHSMERASVDALKELMGKRKDGEKERSVVQSDVILKEGFSFHAF